MARKAVAKVKKLTPSVLDQVLTLIESGTNIVTACTEIGCSARTLYYVAANDPDVGDRLERAKSLQHDAMLRDVQEIADEPMPENVDPRLLNAHMQRQRIRTDARLKILQLTRGGQIRAELKTKDASVSLEWGA